MTKKKFSITLASILLLFALCFSMASCSTINNGNTEAEETVETDAIKTSIVNTSNVKLAASAPMMVSTKGVNVITQKLTATVLPASATNKQVDWTVAWGDTSNTSDVSSYITVTPDSDGSTNATVTCKAAFSGDIVITATTRQNGYKATCLVTFVGIPANINIVTNLTQQSDGYHVSVGNSYTFSTELSNPFGTVGNAYKTLNVSVEGVGKIMVASKEVRKSGAIVWSTPKEKDFSTINPATFLTATMGTDGKITVNVTKSIESYYAYYDIIDSGRTEYYSDCFQDYATNCYFKITLTEPKSGVSSSFNIVLDPGAVNSVSLSSNEMFF